MAARGGGHGWDGGGEGGHPVLKASPADSRQLDSGHLTDLPGGALTDIQRDPPWNVAGGCGSRFASMPSVGYPPVGGRSL